MGDYNKDSEQDKDKTIDFLLREMCDCSREDLLDEFEAASNTDIPLPIPEPAADEFEKIWSRIQEERAESKNVPESDQPEHPKVIKPRFGWKRLAAIGLIACLVAGSGCMVAMGTKSYFYREKELGDGQQTVFVNDFYKGDVNGEEEAYNLIEKELGIQPLKLGYIPSDMYFLDVYIKDGYARLCFTYNDEFVYFIQSKFNKKVSYDYKSDREEIISVKNKWLNKDIDIKIATLEDGSSRNEISFVDDGKYYRLWGPIEIQEFKEIVERLTY